MSTEFFSQIIGCSAALLSAIAWAFGSLLFRKVGDEATPLAMNLVKASVGVLYLGAVLLLVGLEPMSYPTFLILGVSGLLGIAIGDTFFFKALVCLGPKLTLLLEPLVPVVTIALSAVFLHEKLSSLEWIGAFFSLGGVSVVLWKSAPEDKTEKKWRLGILCSLLATLGMSAGIVLAKIGLAKAPALQATFTRLLWGSVGLWAWGTASGQILAWLTPFKNIRLLRLILGSIAVVIFGGFWLSLVSLKYITASVSTILCSTTPLWILPISFFLLKEKISRAEVAGAVLAVCGIVLIFMG